MIDGSVMAAYLAATLIAKEDRRLTPAMSTALDRLRACVTAKVGAWPVSQLLRQPPSAVALEAIGSALEVAARADGEFARQLDAIFEELEDSGARFLVDDAREHFRDDETPGSPYGNKRSDGVICEACGESNRIGVEFCVSCGSYLPWDSPAAEPEEEFPRSAPPPAPEPPPSPIPELRGGDRRVCPKCNYPLTHQKRALCPNCHHPLIFDDDLSPNPATSPPVPGETSVVGSAASPPASPGATAQLQAVIDRAVSQAVTEGRVLFNPPERMRQGRLERVEVAIARTKDLDDVLRQMVQGRGQARIRDVETSPFMAVELKGPGFDITPLQAATSEQLLRPTALWEFDVFPKRSGSQTLQVCVAMRIPLPDRPDERVSIPVLERHIHVVIDPRYGSQQFLKRNWQWLIATLAGLGGAVAAWLKLFRGGD